MTTTFASAPDVPRFRLREFTRLDWDGYAGAERGPNGELPLLGSTTVSAFPPTATVPAVYPADVVVDATGIELTIWLPDGSDLLWVARLDDRNLFRAQWIATGLFATTAPTGLDLLARLGFVPLGGGWDEYLGRS